MIETLHRFDQNLTLALNSLNCPLTDNINQLFSDIPVWIPMYVLIAVFLFVRLGWKSALIVIASLTLTFCACDQLANFCKDTIGRLRPSYDSYMIDNGIRILEGKGSLFGFFSGHASNSFGFATCSLMGFKNDKSRNYKKYTWMIYIWAIGVSLSRVFAGKHYFGDVFVGILVGSTLGFVFALIARKFISSLES